MHVYVEQENIATISVSNSSYSFTGLTSLSSFRIVALYFYWADIDPNCSSKVISISAQTLEISTGKDCFTKIVYLL